jgi:hypothetical protein
MLSIEPLLPLANRLSGACLLTVQIFLRADHKSTPNLQLGDC